MSAGPSRSCTVS
ncbi:hypothetical protein EC60172_2459A, partial [Escherichia coli 6.0172]